MPRSASVTYLRGTAIRCQGGVTGVWRGGIGRRCRGSEAPRLCAVTGGVTRAVTVRMQVRCGEIRAGGRLVGRARSPIRLIRVL